MRHIIVAGDMCVLIPTSPFLLSPSTGYSRCQYYSCPSTPDSLSEVKQFAQSFDAWMADYVPAHLKMTSHPVGFENLEYPQQ